MDLVSFDIYTIAATLALFFLYAFSRLHASRTKRNNPTKQTRIVPQPSWPLPLIGHLHLLGGRTPIARTLAAISENSGSIFSLKVGSYDLIIVNSSDIARECFTKNDTNFATRPNIAAGRYMGYNNAFFALAPYGKYWRSMRKLATLDLLSHHRLESLKYIRDSEIYMFVKNLQTMVCTDSTIMQNITAVPICKMIEHLTFNINARMIAGKRFQGGAYNKDESEAGRLKQAIKDASYLFGVFVMADAIPHLHWMDLKGYLSSMKKTAKEIDSVLGSWLDEHLQNQAVKVKEGTDRDKDFMDVMLTKLGEDSETEHTRENVIKATALTLMLTGSGSTAITVTWALSLLLNHPKALRAAQQELDDQIGKDRWVEESDIKDLMYLQAIVKETLRLYPPAPLTGIRAAMEDCELAGYHVPKGTRLLVNIWKIQRDAHMWTNPHEFQPERFLTTNAHVELKSTNFEYMPFGYGRRSCPGMTFGMQVVHLTLARILQGFDVAAMVDGPVNMEEGLGVAMPKLRPLDVVLTPRLPLSLYDAI